MTKRTFVIGDLHGRIHALNDVLDKSGFDNEKDRLITLGDIVDGGGFTRQVVDRLLEIKDRVDVRGNHDDWHIGWIDSDPRIIYVNYLWQNQGGYATQKSYDYEVTKIPESHKEFFRNQKTYYIDDENRIFVHGGFKPGIRIEFQDHEFITWDRKLIKYARKRPVPDYARVFVGHTSVKLIIGKNKPVVPQFFNNLVMCDLGDLRVGMVNVEDTDEYYVSKKDRKYW